MYTLGDGMPRLKSVLLKKSNEYRRFWHRMHRHEPRMDGSKTGDAANRRREDGEDDDPDDGVRDDGSGGGGGGGGGGRPGFKPVRPSPARPAPDEHSEQHEQPSSYESSSSYE